MSQTTAEFAKRLNAALSACPAAPAERYGRASWLARELAKSGVIVSLNTTYKWTVGAARPRADRMAALSRLLGADEVWLTLGREPGSAHGPGSANGHAPVDAHGAGSAVLIAAGLLETLGARVLFGSPREGEPHLTASILGEEIDFVVGSPIARTAEGWTFALPATPGTRPLGVLTKDGRTSLLDLKDAARPASGGVLIAAIRMTSPGMYEDAVEGKTIVPVADAGDLIGRRSAD